jgi:contractile injection system tube protein
MPRNLEPTLVALPAQIARGALIALPPPVAGAGKTGKPDNELYEVLRFQYNPETVTRSRTGQWEHRLDKKSPSAAQITQEQARARGGSLKSKSEIISFKLVFDATELMLGGRDTGADQPFQGNKGVLPELAVLERFALGPDQIPDQPKKDNEFPLVSLTPTEAVLVLGPRSFPGVITQLNIVEQRFNSKLVPVRAEVDIRFRVLEATSTSITKNTNKLFEELLAQRASLASLASDAEAAKGIQSAFGAGSGISAAISAAIRPAGTPGPAGTQ